jgi:hypothetical protein
MDVGLVDIGEREKRAPPVPIKLGGGGRPFQAKDPGAGLIVEAELGAAECARGIEGEIPADQNGPSVLK